jgi:3-oxoacyl-[acyl-carrier protein] reductase
MVLHINLKSTFFCSQKVLRYMSKAKYGKIINLASVAGKIDGVAVGAHDAASKAGVICVTKSFALYVAPFNVNINVNCVCPGLTETPYISGTERSEASKSIVCYAEVVDRQML